MTERKSSLASLGKDASIEDLARPWGQRTPQRWTYGTPGRTLFVEAMKKLDEELTELRIRLEERRAKEGWLEPVVEVQIPGLRDFVTSLCESWSGELGKDTADFIKAVAAAKGQTSIHVAPKPPEEVPA